MVGNDWDIEPDPDEVVSALTPPSREQLDAAMDEDLSDVRQKLQEFISRELLNGGEVYPDDNGVFVFVYGDTHICIEAYEG